MTANLELGRQLRSAVAAGYAGTEALEAFARSVIANISSTQEEAGNVAHRESEVSRALAKIAFGYGAQQNWTEMERVIKIMELVLAHWPQNTEVAAQLATALFNAIEFYCKVRLSL